MRQPKTCANPGKTNVPLDAHLRRDVRNWLEWGILDLIRDYYLVQEHFFEYGLGNGISDYSYLITPAFKALEGTLLQIAKGLEFDLTKYNYKVGWILDEKRLDNFYQEVLNKIETLTAEKKRDIRQWLSSARLFLRHLRHAPAHYFGERQETFTKAFDTGNTIIFTINEIVFALLETGVLPKLPKGGAYPSNQHVVDQSRV